MLATHIQVNRLILNSRILCELRGISYLFLDLPIDKDILQCDIKLAQIVLAKPVMIPTDAL